MLLSIIACMDLTLYGHCHGREVEKDSVGSNPDAI